MCMGLVLCILAMLINGNKRTRRVLFYTCTYAAVGSFKWTNKCLLKQGNSDIIFPRERKTADQSKHRIYLICNLRKISSISSINLTWYKLLVGAERCIRYAHGSGSPTDINPKWIFVFRFRAACVNVCIRYNNILSNPTIFLAQILSKLNW